MTTTPIPPESTPDIAALNPDALRGLEQYATPAPWEVDGEEIYGPGREWVGECLRDVVGDTQGEADANLIVAMRNALPALLDRLAAAVRETAEAGAFQHRDGRGDHATCEEIERAVAVMRSLLHEADADLKRLRADLAGLQAQRQQALAELARVTAQRDRLRNKLIPKGFGRRNPHCSNCGDERGGPVGHEISECRYRSGMAAFEVAQLLPEQRRAEFWEVCVERYLAMELELASPAPADATGEAETEGWFGCGYCTNEADAIQHGHPVRRVEPAAPAERDIADRWRDSYGLDLDFSAAPAAAEPARYCGYAFVGDVGSFTCNRFAGHIGRHWDSIYEFGWDDDEPDEAAAEPGTQDGAR